MILKLDSNARIESDEHNYVLMKRARTGKRLWRPDGYYKDLGQALVEYSRHKIKKADATTLQEVLTALRTIRKDFEAIGAQCVTLWGKN